VSRRFGPFYLAWFVTKELPDSLDLWTALQQGWADKFGETAVWGAVADAIRAMHREGVYHSDLNLKNILLRQEAAGLAVYIIDFDKAKLFLGKLPSEMVKRNLDRLLRSAQKLDPARRYLPPVAWQRFVDIYYGGSEA
jgi:3-deoxy-D-manno-octulosonic-acid transferase